MFVLRYPDTPGAAFHTIKWGTIISNNETLDRARFEY